MPREFVLPGTRPRYAPDRPWNLVHIKIDVALDFETASIKGTCMLMLEAVRDSDTIELDAVDLDVSEVRIGRKKAKFHNSGKTLRIDAGAVVKKGKARTVFVDYAATPTRGLYFVGPDKDYPDKRVHAWSQGQDDDSPFWFPCIDRPSMKATSEVIARIPKEFTALSNGAVVSDTVRGPGRKVHWRFDTPHSCYLITLVAGEFTVKRAKHEKVDVTYWLPSDRVEDGVRTLERTPEMIDLFSRLFGVDYPYDSYAQIFVSDFIFGGMENTTATTLTDSVLIDERASLDMNVERLVAHELAHQWFGDLVTCRTWGQGWLNEGFATYSEYLWREHADGEDDAFVELDGWAASYFHEDSSRYRRTVATNLYDAPLDVFDAHLYQKGGRILHMLRQYLGDEDFFAALKHYLDKHRLKAVDTSDLSRAIEEATGRAVDWFFDQWILKGAGHPELEVQVAWNAEQSAAEVSVVQKHDVDAVTPLFRLPLTCRFRLGRTDVDVPVEVSDERHFFVIPLKREPTQMIVDPGRPTLAKIKWTKSDALWLAELAGATTAADRITAARQLGRSATAKSVAGLAKALGRDSFWAVRGAAAAALAQTRRSDARDALLSRLRREEEPRVRRAIVTALGAFRGDEKCGAALVKLLEAGDPSCFVEADAAHALGRLRVGHADTLREVATRDAFMDVIRRGAYAGLAELGKPEQASFLIAATERGGRSRGRCSAALAAARLVARRGDQFSREVRERLEQLLFDSDFLVQLSAIEALGILGDPAASSALADAAERDRDGRLRRRAREKMRDLAEERSQRAQLEGLQSNLDTVTRELRALQKRVEHLESTEGNVVKGATRTKRRR